MAFTQVNFLPPLQAFLEKPPFLNEGERLQIELLQINTDTPEGTGGALALAEVSPPKITKDIQGNTALYTETTLTLTLRRFTSHSELRAELAAFILGYIQWINHAQSLRGTKSEPPLLPTFGNGRREKLVAFGGKRLGTTPILGQEEYEIRLQVGFETDIQ